MQARQVGRSGLQVSPLALGTLGWSPGADPFALDELLTTFVEAGGTLIDTAPVHGDGHAELLFGELLARHGWREQVVLAGAAGVARRGDQVVRDTSRGGLLRQLDASLRDLGTDHLDLWQIRGHDGHTPLEETLGAMEYAVTSGRARYVGLTNLTGWRAALAHATLAGRAARVLPVACQSEYSLLQRGPEVTLMPAAEHLGLGLIGWSGLGRGVLTGKYRHGIPADSRGADQRWERFVAPYLGPERAGVVEAVCRAAEGLGTTPARVALAWALQQPQVASLVVGPRTAAQLSDCLGAVDLDLPVEIHMALTDVSGGLAPRPSEEV